MADFKKEFQATWEERAAESQEPGVVGWELFYQRGDHAKHYGSECKQDNQSA